MSIVKHAASYTAYWMIHQVLCHNLQKILLSIDPDSLRLALVGVEGWVAVPNIELQVLLQPDTVG